METNQTTQPTMQQPPIQNKKMMFCKTCGAQMAKSAKKCPSCGAKNSRSKIVRVFRNLFIVVSIILVGIIVINILNAPKIIGIGDIVEEGNLKIELKNVQYDNTIYVEGDTRLDNFLTPIQKDDIKDKYLYSYNKDTAPVVITVVVENIGKNDTDFGPKMFAVNYDDGNRYYATGCYAKTESDYGILGYEWKEFDKITLEKVTGGAIEVKILAWIPLVVFENSKSLTLEFCDAVYKIR